MKFVVLAMMVIAAWAHDARADKKTVCTITVNSPDEKETLRRQLPQDDYQFVELVERGRSDWLASACRNGVRCDVLLISGHFDGGTEFYSDRLDAREYLSVDEMERVSCSDSCPGLFSQLKEVYLFGCNTLNAQATRSASGEIGRSLVRSGYSAEDAQRLSRLLDERYAESNRERMRNVFKDVPVIYGFSSKAPLGPAAASLLERYFQSGSGGEIGSGRLNAKLLGLFAPSSMTVAAGASDSDPNASFRRDVCQLADDRLSSTERLEFVHQVMRRDMAEVRMFLDHLERYTASLAETEPQSPSVSRALAEIAGDEAARTRYLDFARDADRPAVRARMLELARSLGWLSPAGQRAELMRMIGEELAASSVSSNEVDLICALNKNRELDADIDRLHVSTAQADKVGHAGILACLGNAEARGRVLRALTSANDKEVQVAQVYLQHRPITDATELHGVATAIARMKGSDTQVRALDVLARYHLSDRESLDELTRLFPLAKALNVQRAIAGILIRSDYKTIAKAELVRALREHRLKSPDGEDLIDALIRRLQAS